MKTAIAKLGVLITATMLLAACGNSEGPGKGGGQVGLLSINLPPAELKVKVQNSAKKFDTVLETDAAMKEALI